MKHFLLLTVCLALFGEAAWAEKRLNKKTAVEEVSGAGYGMAGCGLGSVLFGSKQGLIQVVAATANFIGLNCFAMTSGTSNCIPEESNTHSAEIFIHANLDALEKDIARGSGETLSHFGHLIGCNQALGPTLQSRYDTIFSSPNPDAHAVTGSILNALKQDAVLARACAHLG